jgi:hypothetical protein
MVNWKRVQRPKRLGGLGILDLQRFGRALRLRWPWYKSTEQSKPWANMHIALSKSETDIFWACTSIEVRNGINTSFWHDRWLHGLRPQELAPALYNLAWRKGISVAQGCSDRKWMNGLKRITTTKEIDQFITLWTKIQTMQLTDQEDKVTWKLTADAKYSTKTAYEIQFAGSFPDYEWHSLWEAKMEPKCQFFSWLLMQNRLWTTDQVSRHGAQINPICQ